MKRITVAMKGIIIALLVLGPLNLILGVFNTMIYLKTDNIVNLAIGCFNLGVFVFTIVVLIIIVRRS